MPPPILRRTGQQTSVTRSINKQVDAWIKKTERAVSDFNQKNRVSLLRKAARPLIKQARSIAPRSAKPHYRYKKLGFRSQSGTVKITYNPGNLRRSIRVLKLKKSKDVFVGPQFQSKKASEYGGPGQPVDAYYAAAIYGSARAFQRKVLLPAARASEGQVINKLKKESLAAIKKNAAQRGIKTN